MVNSLPVPCLQDESNVVQHTRREISFWRNITCAYLIYLSLFDSLLSGKEKTTYGE